MLATEMSISRTMISSANGRTISAFSAIVETEVWMLKAVQKLSLPIAATTSRAIVRIARMPSQLDSRWRRVVIMTGPFRCDGRGGR